MNNPSMRNNTSTSRDSRGPRDTQISHTVGTLIQSGSNIMGNIAGCTGAWCSGFHRTASVQEAQLKPPMSDCGTSCGHELRIWRENAFQAAPLDEVQRWTSESDFNEIQKSRRSWQQMQRTDFLLERTPRKDDIENRNRHGGGRVKILSNGTASGAIKSRNQVDIGVVISTSTCNKMMNQHMSALNKIYIMMRNRVQAQKYADMCSKDITENILRCGMSFKVIKM
ncbi:hypothetical protein C8R45DRAFT_938667 [Mycena sanguinolenta]|nr:hypothetical protein C8R45DRAFT_938667 [Mycena sanguinolenta]